MEDLTSSILDFQANVVRMIYKRKTAPVDMDLPEVQSALDVIWTSAKIEDYLEFRRSIGGRDSIARSSPEKWVHLGFRTENLRGEFARVGLLGLDCLVCQVVCLLFIRCDIHVSVNPQTSFVAHNPEYFAKVVLEQLNRQPERRCPLAVASSEVVELLTDHWSVFAPGCMSSGSFSVLERILIR
jgi:engulfment and cell motility protein 1